MEKIIIFGNTGFVGTWLTEYLLMSYVHKMTGLSSFHVKVSGSSLMRVVSTMIESSIGQGSFNIRPGECTFPPTISPWRIRTACCVGSTTTIELIAKRTTTPRPRSQAVDLRSNW